MNIIVGCLNLAVLLGIVPVLLGSLTIGKVNKEGTKSFAFCYLTGIIIMLALIQIYGVPMTLLQYHFTSLYWLYMGTISGLCVLAVIIKRKYIVEMIIDVRKKIKRHDKKWLIVIVGMLIPTCILSFYTPYIYGDDKTYLTMVNDMVSSDTMYLLDTLTGEKVNWISAKYSLSSYWTFLAVLVKATGIHTLILCKTILPFFIMAITYVVQLLLARYLFHEDDRKVLVYMFFINIVHLFGCFSDYSVSFRLYTWIWQSKAFLALIVIPFLFYYCNVSFEKKMRGKECFILLLSIVAACSTTLTGTGLAAAMVMLLATIYAVKNRTIKTFILAGIACCPTVVYMVLYLKYDFFVSWLRLQEVFRGIS